MIVIKYGGNAMRDGNGFFATAIKDSLASGESVVVVHGGGPQINQALAEAGITSEFVGGYRVTTPEILIVVDDVLTKNVGPRIAAGLSNAGVPSESISGRTFLTGEILHHLVDNSAAHLGLVGNVTNVQTDSLLHLLKQGITPVVAPLATDSQSGLGLNVNADLAAAAIAGALKAHTLIVMTDVAGIYRDWSNKDSLISEIAAPDLSVIKETFSGGMAPKVQACLDAITAGAQAVRIIDGTEPTTLALALAGSGGTLVRS